MAESRGHVLIAGVTTRALAVSAARAGYRVTAIDAFGDLDLRAAAEVIVARPVHPGLPYDPVQAAAEGDRVDAEFAAFTSNFENYPPAVQRLARGRRLLGNSAETLMRVRNPFAVSRVLRRYGHTAPETQSRPPASARGQWLMKPRRSGGGHGIMPWTRGRTVPRSMYLQQRIAGIPGSISFAADGSSAVVLGFSRQLIGESRLGARRYRYCGSLLGNHQVKLFPRQHELLERAGEVAGAITREFHLIGLNGIDFVARHGIPYPIEVNPRYSASMELIERAHRISMFQIHFDACWGVLPAFPERQSMLYGKGIVFAREDTQIPKAGQWVPQPWMADVPRAGERIQHGRPICTVFASARSPAACHRLLWKRGAWVYRSVASKGQWAA
ncbi:MAG TPA: ATP-grasp domain-containing protein [Gemmatimonadales bacterium]|jgi:predicted ATP-grasp superfamily ATP-dependent carboligase|nr:ATP-grasp domain-containing protein [Gemmatimonadales bacterium]